jgi:hypothetical protein
MKAPLALTRLFLLVLLLFVGSAFLIGASQPPKPANEKAKLVANEEVRLFHLKHLEPAHMINLMGQLVPNLGTALRVTALSGKTLAAVGSPEALASVQKLIDTLDVEGTGEEQNERFQVFSVRSIDSDLEQALKMIVTSGQIGQYVVDRQRNLVIVSGDPFTVDSVKRLLTYMDKPREKPAQRQMQVRLLWLASGLSRPPDDRDKDSLKPPPDLKPVIDELARIGIVEPILVSQSIVNVVENQDFKINGPVDKPFGNYRLQTDGTAQLTEGNTAASLRLTLEVQYFSQNQKAILCDLNSTIVSPPGHFTVLGITPSKSCTSIFVVQVQAKK